jgi:hypothetical protein
MINGYSAIQAAIRKIQDQAAVILLRSEACSGAVAEILRAARVIDNAFRDGIPADSTATPQHMRDNEKNRRNKSKRYRREAVGGNEVLAEYRDDSPIPLRANVEVVLAVADILARAKAPLSFEAIQRDLKKSFRSETTEYQARIALRFLQSSGVKLVGRRNARYEAIEPSKIKRATASALANLVAA